MIVDSHVYCFGAPDSPAGHASGKAHLEFWQRAYAQHHQPAYSLLDRSPGDSRVLLEPAPDDPWRLSTRRNFRVDRISNRLVWTVDGVDYTKQYLPPNVIEYGAGAIIAEMDYAGVDWGLIHVDATLDKDAAFIGACVKAFPDRLRAMAPIDEWLIPTKPDAAIKQAFDAVRVHGIQSIKIIPSYAYRLTASKSFDDAAWRPFWDAVATLGVPVFFTLGPSPGAKDPRQGFVQELNRLRRWQERYPGVPSGITHGYPWRDYLEGGRFVLPDEMWAPFAGSDLTMEVCLPIRIGDLFEYPYRECWPVLEAMVKNIGADRLFWGTDMPFQNRFCTYRQSRRYLEDFARERLKPGELKMIMGGTAARLLGLPAI